jgi:ubiquitin carboxyl-terminal hydrolase 9/24
MRSQQKWWFLSEADEEQLGTDRDIDYYQYKSKEDEELQPPPRVVG